MRNKLKKAIITFCAFAIALVGCGGCVPTGESSSESNSAQKPNNNLANFDLDYYDTAKYLDYYWDQNITYNESAMLVRNQDGSLDPVKLLYPVDGIVSVRSADLQTKYVENVDYKIENRKLIILENGNIPVFEYEEMYFETNPGESSSGSTVENNKHVQAFPTVDGKYEIYEEGGVLYEHQIAVTYYHKDKGGYTVPATQSEEFERFIGKLERGESVNIACLGDSISDGWSASGFFSPSLSPYMPNYFGLFRDFIKMKYNYENIFLYEDPTQYKADGANEAVRVKMTNFSVGGMNSYWGVKQTAAVSAVRPDLVIVGFGMNDGSDYIDSKQYFLNIRAIVTQIRNENPHCAFILLSTMLPNEKICWSVGGRSIYGTQETYIPELQTLARSSKGVALTDITTLHKEYLQVKNHRDMSGNNVNHPNDFLTRLYAQAIIKTIFG